MNKLSAALGGVAFSTGLFLTGGAAAEIVDFEDIDLQGELSLPAPYVIGDHADFFYFANFGCYDSILADEILGFSGYTNGATSGIQAAYSVYAAPSSIVLSNPSAGVSFDLAGGNFTAAWREGLQVRVRAFVGFDNEEIYDQTFTINSDASYLDLGIAGASMVTFETYGGTSAGFIGDGSNFIMDDIDLTVVPAPSVITTVLLAGVFRRRRRETRGI